MAGKSRKWAEGCAIGCGALVVLGVVVGAITWLGMMQLSGKAVDTRAALDAAFPSQEVYTPPLDGAVEPDRMDRFLAVREALMPWCETFSGYRAYFGRMKDFAESEDEPPPGDFVKATGFLPKVMWRLGQDVHAYAVERNETLLAQGMGLGEYTWIFVIGYLGWLGHEPTEFMPADGEQPKVYGGRVRQAVMDMMQRHVAELEAAFAEDSGAAPPNGGEDLALWRAELVALQNDPKRTPFADGLPPALAASFEPYRDELERGFCPATCDMDLTRTERTGLWYDHR